MTAKRDASDRPAGPARRASFELVGPRDGAARLGRFRTARGDVTTPTLLPVMNPNLPLVSAREMRDRFGAEMLITNSYVIWKRPSLRARALAEGAGATIDWDGPLMTDSGTFQMYVYGDIDVAPQDIVAFQRDIRVDVGTILDVFTTPEKTHAEAAAELEETADRARAAAAIKGESMALAATVQGGVFPDLRSRSALRYQEIDADFHPIGGVVPLMEQQRYAELVDLIVAAKRELPPERPVHLFGAGHPMNFPLFALLGCDFFDSSSYAKYAADGRMMFSDGTVRVTELEENPCACATCTEHGRAVLAEGEPAIRLRALHNLAVSFAAIREVRQAIRDGRLWELVEMRARAHPALADALPALARHADWIETLEPASRRSAMLLTSEASLARPAVARARARLLHRYRPAAHDALLVPQVRKPASFGYLHLQGAFAESDVEPVAVTTFGPVPFALDETYPFAQSVEPVAGPDSRDVADLTDAFVRHHGLRRVSDVAKGARAGRRDLDRERVAAISDYQFGRGAGAALTRGAFAVEKSRNTGKIRTVHVDGEHVLSLRAEDGLFTLKLAGARRLHASLPRPVGRLTVAEDSVPFNRDGKSVFGKFAVACDPALRPGDECLVVDAADSLVACAQLLLAPSEVGAFRVGVAAWVREGAR
ncbi:MAG: tRNA guanosine(15) transglycosylase TgtA [Thermoplasmatota archaeon]